MLLKSLFKNTLPAFLLFAQFSLAGGIGVIAAEKPNYEVNWGCATNESISSDTFGCPEQVDIVTGPWLLDGWKTHHTTWLEKFELEQNKGKTPYIMAYMIAGLGRRDQGLQDCDLSALSVCTDGANYIRDNLFSITQEYQSVANNIFETHGNKKLYIHMEPDFYLYHSGELQKNPLTVAEAHTVMNALTDIIATTLPNAEIVMDVSTWNPNLAMWHNGLRNISFGGVVGKNFDADVYPDNTTYEQVIEDIDMPLIINTAHTFGGFFTPYNTTWETENHGVYAVIQAPTDVEAYEEFLEVAKQRILDIPYYEVKTFPRFKITNYLESILSN